VSWNKYGAANRPKRRAFYRAYYAAHREEILARINEYRATPAGREVVRRAYETQKAKYPEKVAARAAVARAVRTGALAKQPCERCGAKKAEAHHSDYSQPLLVEWLCGVCHREEHRTIRELARFHE